MKRFIRRCLLFAAIPLLIVAALAVLKPLLHRPYKLDRATRTILVGDSHVQYTIDDSDLPGIENLSVNSESYLFSYYKLRNILEHNPQVENVILGFSHHNLSSYYDEYLTGQDAAHVTSRYFNLLDGRGLLELAAINPGLWEAYVDHLLSIRGGGHPYVEGFRTEAGSGLVLETWTRRRIAHQYFSGESVRALSGINARYLERIVEMCKANDIRLTLISTPMHEGYVSRVPRAYGCAYEETIAKHGLSVIDFEGLQLGSEHFLPDGDHVNAKGAALATEWFAAEWSR